MSLRIHNFQRASNNIPILMLFEKAIQILKGSQKSYDKSIKYEYI